MRPPNAMLIAVTSFISSLRYEQIKFYCAPSLEICVWASFPPNLPQTLYRHIFLLVSALTDNEACSSAINVVYVCVGVLCAVNPFATNITAMYPSIHPSSVAASPHPSCRAMLRGSFGTCAGATCAAFGRRRTHRQWLGPAGRTFVRTSPGCRSLHQDQIYLCDTGPLPSKNG